MAHCQDNDLLGEGVKSVIGDVAPSAPPPPWMLGSRLWPGLSRASSAGTPRTTYTVSVFTKETYCSQTHISKSPECLLLILNILQEGGEGRLVKGDGEVLPAVRVRLARSEAPVLQTISVFKPLA